MTCQAVSVPNQLLLLQSSWLIGTISSLHLEQKAHCGTVTYEENSRQVKFEVK